MRASEPGIAFIKRWEGLKLTASPDPLAPGVWDVGYGCVVKCAEPFTITEAEADRLMRERLAEKEEALDGIVRVTLAQHEHDAVISWLYNVGETAAAKSTLMQKLNASHFDEAADQFRVWKWAGGAIRKGLIKRRDAERNLFLHANYGGAP
jgi:lysozyme